MRRNGNLRSPNALRTVEVGAPEICSGRARTLVDGLHQAAAALEALAEGREPDPTGVTIGTQEPSGLWFERVPELNLLFEAIATLNTVPNERTKMELGNPVRQRARMLAEFLHTLAGDRLVGVAPAAVACDRVPTRGVIQRNP